MAVAVLVAAAAVSRAQGTAKRAGAPPEVVLHLNAEWRAKAKLEQGKTAVEDSIAIVYNAEARYELLPSTRDPNILSPPRKITVQGSCSVEGGGHTGNGWSWTYSPGIQKPSLPGVGVNVRRGTFGFPVGGALDAIPGGGCDVAVKGQALGVPWDLPGPAHGVLALLSTDAQQKIGGAEIRGDFEPFSRQFRRSDVFSGSVTCPGGSGTWRISYDLSFGGAPEVEAEMWVDKGDEDWLPGGSVIGEGYAGNVLLVHARVFPKDHPERTSRKARFRFALKEVSTEPGVCMNWPPQGEEGVKDTPDLAFEKKTNPDLDVEAEWNAADGKAGPRTTTKEWANQAVAIVSSFDYGGYGKLTVLADLEGGGTVEAHLRGKKDVRNMGIPRDENGNHVADAWEGKTVRASAADADEDWIPAPAHKGDGLTLYAEYRGFIVGTREERHLRTDPSKQTLFIHSDDAELTKGIELFRARSRLEVVEISEEQYVSNQVRVVNANSKTGRAGFGGLGMQHGLHLTLRQLDPYTGGQSRTGPPRFVDEVQIAVGSADPDVIAHELGHAAGMPHHGKGRYLCDMKSGCSSKMDATEAKRYTTRTGNKLSDVSVAHDEFSGGEECIMRYPEADYIERIEGGKVRYYRYRYPDGMPPKAQVRFCRADRGTGVNDSHHKPWPKAGDATPGCGNSVQFVRISDRYDSQEGELRARGCLP